METTDETPEVNDQPSSVSKRAWSWVKENKAAIIGTTAFFLTAAIVAARTSGSEEAETAEDYQPIPVQVPDPEPAPTSVTPIKDRRPPREHQVKEHERMTRNGPVPVKGYTRGVAA